MDLLRSRAGGSLTGPERVEVSAVCAPGHGRRPSLGGGTSCNAPRTACYYRWSHATRQEGLHSDPAETWTVDAGSGGALPGSSIPRAENDETAAGFCITTSAACITTITARNTPRMERVFQRVASITPAMASITPGSARLTPSAARVSLGLAVVSHETAGVFRTVLRVLRAELRVMRKLAGVFPAILGVLQAELWVRRKASVVLHAMLGVSAEHSGALQRRIAMLPETSRLRPARHSVIREQNVDTSSLVQLPENPAEETAVRLLAGRTAELLVQIAVCIVRCDCVSRRTQSQHNPEPAGSLERKSTSMQPCEGTHESQYAR